MRPVSNRAKPRGRPPAADSTATRAGIIDAARRVFAAEGYRATSLRAIAAEVGLTAPAISHHFGSKTALFDAVTVDTDRRLLTIFADAVGGADGFPARLAAILDATATVIRDEPSITGFVTVAQIERRRTTTGTDPPIEETPMATWLTAMVSEGIAAGEVDPSADPPAVVAMLLAITLGMAVFATVIQPARIDSLVEEASRLLAGELLTATARDRFTGLRAARRVASTVAGPAPAGAAP